MEKKFDFKTIVIACLLFFGFVFLLFYKFSSADDSITHYKKASEIFSSQQDFDAFKATLPNKILPEWYTETESMANMLYTLGCFAMGDYIGVSEGLVTELSGQITGDPLFLKHFVFDYDSLSWVFDSDTDDFIKSKLDSHIYVYPSPSQVGGWFELPASVYLPSKPSWGTCNLTPSTGSMLYVTCIGDVCYVASFTQSSFTHQWTGSHQITSHPLNTTYYGSESVGYYTGLTLALNNAVYITGTSTQTYNSRDEALAYLFGFDEDNLPGSDPYLIDGVTIRDDNFVVKPLSYPSSVMVDYPSLITEPDYDSDDYRLIFEYTPTMEVPFWLKNPTTEPISFELPTDYDFANIEYEFEADPSYLAGAGIVQDVFEILPASLQGLIVLFGAGSLAFIFLRR